MKILYNLNEAAVELGISRKTLEREMIAGRFPRPLKIATSSLVSRKDLEAYVGMLERVRERTTILPDWMISLRSRPVPEAPSRPAPTENSIRPSIPNVPRAFRSDDPNRLP
jgi:predicted DNA-binding transcriptional regulator AlpA